MTDNVFSNPDDTTSPEDTTQEPTKTPETVVESTQSNLFADQLKMITAEDGRQKYVDVQSALMSIPHAQSTIDTLKAKVAEQEALLTSARSVEAVLEQLQTTPTSQEPSIPAVQGLGADDVSAMVTKQLAEREKQSVRQSNLTFVNNELISKFKTPEVAIKAMSDKAVELGMDVKNMESLAASSPKMVLALFSDTTSANANTINSTVNSDNLPKNNPDLKPVMIGASTQEVMDSARQHGIFID